MATTSVRTSSGSSLWAQAAIAGIIGGILIDLFLAIATHRSPVAIWQFVASTIVGQGAFASRSYAVLGFIVHFVVAIVWAEIYAYVFNALGQLKNWILGAIVLGIVVAAVMNLILAIKIGAPWGPSFAQGVLPHIVFYALPVALYMARFARVEARSA
jgi:hypothetical protein